MTWGCLRSFCSGLLEYLIPFWNGLLECLWSSWQGLVKWCTSLVACWVGFRDTVNNAAGPSPMLKLALLVHSHAERKEQSIPLSRSSQNQNISTHLSVHLSINLSPSSSVLVWLSVSLSLSLSASLSRSPHRPLHLYVLTSYQ